MKILYLCNALDISSGWGVVNYYTVREACLKGHQVFVLTEQGKKTNLYHNNLKVYSCLFPVGNMLKKPFSIFTQIRQIKKLIKENDIDCVHVLIEPYLIYFSIINHPKIFLNLVGTYSISIFKNRFLKLFYSRALKKTQKLFAISQYSKDFFLLNVKHNEAYVDAIPLGVDLNIFKILKEVKKEMAFSFVGQIKPRKGTILALKAFNLLAAEYPQLHFYIVGDQTGEYAQLCREYVEENKLKLRVTFLGLIETKEIVLIYNRCIGNILPSINTNEGKFEGFGLIHLEANACGIPTIGSINCGNESAIIHNKTGFLCSQNDVDQIKEAMLKIIKSCQNEMSQKMRIDCLQFAKENSWPKYFEKIEREYRRL